MLQRQQAAAIFLPPIGCSLQAFFTFLEKIHFERAPKARLTDKEMLQVDLLPDQFICDHTEKTCSKWSILNY